VAVLGAISSLRLIQSYDFLLRDYTVANCAVGLGRGTPAEMRFHCAGCINCRNPNHSLFCRARNTPSQPGSIGQNALRLPARWAWNFSIGKNFSLAERYRLQLRGDMFKFP